MKLEELRRTLLTAARCASPSDRVPYAFERRVMAHLRSPPQVDEWQWWGRALWYGASACTGLALLVSVWSTTWNAAPSSNLSEDLEQTVLLAADEAAMNW